MTLENKIKGAFKERVYNRVDPSTGIKYVVKKPSIIRKLGETILGGILGIMPVAGCTGGGGGGGGPAPVNKAPNITSTPITTAVENQFPPYAYDVDATDPEGDNPLVHSLVTAPTGASIVSSTGVINWSPTENPVTPGTGYSVNFTAEVTDSKGNKSQQSWVVNVTNVGAVNTTLQDFFTNGLTGLDAILYDATNTFTINNTTGSNVTFFNIPDGNYVFRVNGNSTSIHSYQEGTVSVSGNNTNIGTKKIFKTSDLAITSTNIAYRDNNNNPNALQKVKHNTGTRPGDLPIGGPHTIVNWQPTVFSSGVPFWIDATNAPSGYATAIRNAVSSLNTSAGVTVFTETPSSTSSSTGIDFAYGSFGANGNTVHLSYNTDGSNKTKRIDLTTGLTAAVVEAVARHTLCRTLWSRNSDVDTIYLMHPNLNASGNLHSDEVALIQVWPFITHGTNMDNQIVP